MIILQIIVVNYLAIAATGNPPVGYNRHSTTRLNGYKSIEAMKSSVRFFKVSFH